LSEVAHTLGKTASRLAAIEDDVVTGTWRPTPETMTVILRHTLGIVAALQAIVVTMEAAASS